MVILQTKWRWATSCDFFSLNYFLSVTSSSHATPCVFTYSLPSWADSELSVPGTLYASIYCFILLAQCSVAGVLAAFLIAMLIYCYLGYNNCKAGTKWRGMEALCWSLFPGTGPWCNQQKGVGGISVGQGSSVVPFAAELCLFHVCWKDFIPQDRLSVWPLLQTLRSVSAHEKSKGLVAWSWGRGGSA